MKYYAQLGIVPILLSTSLQLSACNTEPMANLDFTDCTVTEMMNKTPNTNKAISSDVVGGKTYWELVEGNWNLQTGTGSISGTDGCGCSAALPQTGQTTSYATGDDGDLQKGVTLPTPRFTDNGDGTVTDNLTGLIWLKNANCFGRKNWTTALSYANNLSSGTCGLTDGSSPGDWHLPNQVELTSLINRGYSNPALSNVAGTGQWSESDAFSGVQTKYYWSSTTHGGDTTFALSVNLYYGYINIYEKTYIYNVLPVRSGQMLLSATSVAVDSDLGRQPKKGLTKTRNDAPKDFCNRLETGATGSFLPKEQAATDATDNINGIKPENVVKDKKDSEVTSSNWDKNQVDFDMVGGATDCMTGTGRFTENKNGTVTDNCTKLVWLKNANCFGKQKWKDANDMEMLMNNHKECIPLNTCATDWHLPTIHELHSLLNYSRYIPALSKDHPFLGVQTYNNYWSSTSLINYTFYAWHVSFKHGGVYTSGKSDAKYVWPLHRRQ